jgi:broad specificity phosphatase PhoE
VTDGRLEVVLVRHGETGWNLSGRHTWSHGYPSDGIVREGPVRRRSAQWGGG